MEMRDEVVGRIFGEDVREVVRGKRSSDEGNVL